MIVAYYSYTCYCEEPDHREGDVAITVRRTGTL